MARRSQITPQNVAPATRRTNPQETVEHEKTTEHSRVAQVEDTLVGLGGPPERVEELAVQFAAARGRSARCFFDSRRGPTKTDELRGEMNSMGNELRGEMKSLGDELAVR